MNSDKLETPTTSQMYTFFPEAERGDRPHGLRMVKDPTGHTVKAVPHGVAVTPNGQR